MKRILVFLNSFNVGGVTSVVKGIYNNLDRADTQVDFIRSAQYQPNDFDEQVQQDGSKVYLYHVPKLNRVPIINYRCQRKRMAKEIIRQIDDVSYDVIHIHAHAHIALYIAKKLKIPVRIMHVHEGTPDFGANVEKSFLIRSMWKKRQKLYNKWATIKAGDSLKACKAKFGDQVEKDPNLCVLYPPVDMAKFNPETYGVETDVEKTVNASAFNMIHVGRLVPVKNQSFMIDILSAMNEIRESELYIIGDGEQREALLSYAKVKGVADKLHILPPDTSPAIYRKMQCSLLPSFSEAFGMVAVESQLMGVPCFASTNVPNDVNIGTCQFLSLDASAEEWAKRILREYQKGEIDLDKANLFRIETLIKKIGELYNGRKETLY